MMKKLLSLLFIITITYSYGQESYYNDVDLNLTGLTLKDALATKIINTHSRALDYTPDIWNASRITDANPNNSSQVLLIYGWEDGTDSNVTNDRERGINDNGGSVGDWNREHTFANSLANPDLDQSGDNGPPYADAHNLRPSDVQRNSSRGNKRFATGSGIESGSVTGGWYPGDEWKGDVARVIMYMYLRYGDQCMPTFVGVGSNSSTPDDMIDLFLQWNADDPVSDIEKQRNPYHEDTTNNPFAQGNRNPFIDNPRLATRIWGGPEAEDIWGIYTNTDTEAPSVPTNLIVNNETTSSLDLSWTASTDNTAVTSYDVFVDGNLNTSVTSTSLTIFNLNSNTTYSLTVLAKDAADNASLQSTAVNSTTLVDTQAPGVPTNVAISNETDTTFKVSWTESPDNTLTTSYDIYLDGNLHGNSTTVEYVAMGLTASTTYAVSVLAKDAVNNMSAQTSPINGTTTDGSGSSANELFFSEYVEGSSNNKAIEITNITGNPVDLSGYSIKRQQNGAGDWVTPLTLSGTLQTNEVYVIVNGNAALQALIDEADEFVQVVSPNFGAPINFNGNDPVGLFKNDVLIDIIGVFSGGSANFAKDKTLRRKNSVVSPNTTYTISEWDEFPQNTVDNIGILNSGILNVNDFIKDAFTLYPNPTKGDKIFFNNDSDFKVEIFSLLGKLITTKKIISTENEIDISTLKSGIYLVKITIDNKIVTKKIVKN